ncbi:hypothetical protein PFISCL1PPCAC_16279 [Pristionchus fissidentatus]|uniref:Uncharacterized protein n=1 Tax=Pristionchus fissidentatus TaxID=1538716 RepID=A0AAV5VZG1_9BILA|nr:hypothetical protein PFISCL1PPCAC_16279 [Pristionchus fissidentatus]
MDNASDKKPLLSSNSSRGSEEASKSNKNATATQSKKSVKEDPTSPKTARPATPAAPAAPSSTDAAQHRIVRPTAQARPFSSTNKGLYWILTIIHLCILLTVLFGISAGLLHFVFAQTSERPLYYGKGSFIGGVPAIMFEPVNAKEKFKIRFCPNKTSSFQDFVNRLKNVTMTKASNATSQIQKTSCPNDAKLRTWMGNETEEYCRLGLSDALPTLPNTTVSLCDPSSSEYMGYNSGTPCILIRLTKILGFFPMSDEQEQKDVRPTNESACEQKINFECTAKTNSGASIEMIMADGIPFCTFPFWKQKDYIPPYIMIRPNETLPSGKTTIECKPKLKSLKKLSNNKENKVEIAVEIEECQEEKKST